MTDETPIEEFLPIKPVVLHILVALSSGQAHGYGVMQIVRDHSDGRVELQAGPFYRHLKRLLNDGLVRESSDRPEDADTRRGTYYELTRRGRLVLSAERQRLARLLALDGALVRGPSGAGP